MGRNDSEANIFTFTSLMKIYNLIFRAGISKSNMQTIKKDNTISKTIEFVDMHYKEITEVSVIAEEFHMNSEYLSKKFKTKMGVSLKSYIIDKKLQYSHHLIKLGYNVSEVANMAGFSSLSYFIKLYKNKYGNTPGKEQ